LRLVIFEGARGTGKSTVARAIRQKIPEITLVNPTGFHADGEDGFSKIVHYYDAWTGMVHFLKGHNSTFVFDRFFFTERVFSELYKEYGEDFKIDYDIYLRTIAESADVDILFFTIDDEEELGQRLTRDKVPFGKVEESVAETFKQQELYRNIMNDISKKYSKIKIHTVNTTGKTPDEVETEVFRIIKGGE
jgi:thymidylate kinase